MKINIHEIRKNFNSGEIIWACAFSYASNKESKSLFKEPIKGTFTICKSLIENNHALSNN